MGSSHDVFIQVVRGFRGSFREQVRSEVFEEHICYNSLHTLEKRLSASDEERMKRLDDLAFHIVESVHDRFRSILREEFEASGKMEVSVTERVETFGRRIARYERFFRSVLDDLERFNGRHPLKPLSEETMGRGRKSFAHFKIVAYAYLELFERKRDGKGVGVR
ncbi:hypothetical protein [Hydrogenimonas sp.]